MAKVKSNTTKKIRPSMSPEADENQCISLAMNLVKQRLAEGTASSQEVTHFLKLGSSKEKLEREKLESENRLLKAKTENLESQKRVEELYTEALNAMRLYSGNSNIDYDEDEEDEDEYY